jgi:hypothetical protein
VTRYAPKVARLIQNLKRCKGPALVYSQYRMVEGLSAVKAVLEEQGMQELRVVVRNGVPRLQGHSGDKPHIIIFNNEQPEHTQILVDLFNGNIGNLPMSIVEDVKRVCPDYFDHRNVQGKFIKVILISQAGSEGISLKNVRQVHILEPFWNYIRIQQVIGRAVRARSHLALPEEDRFVDVYLYMLVFTDEQKKKRTDQAWDDQLTSDEVLYKIAERKDMMLGAFLDVLKSSAFDCKVHLQAHRKTQPDLTCAF